MLPRIFKAWNRAVPRILLAAFIGATFFAWAGDDANSKVFPPNSKPLGLSYAEWSAQHWQWLYSLPVDRHPLFGTADCSEGQAGHVWFLGGTFAATDMSEPTPGEILGMATRECTIPSGTALFFPIVDVECSTIEGNGMTEAKLRDCAKFFADLIVPGSLSLEIDGKPVTNLLGYRVPSDLFTFGPLPANNALLAFGFDAPVGATSPSVSDGYFALVKPLSVGQHTIHFTGTLDASSIGSFVFTQDITYYITVVPRGRWQ